MKKNPHCTQFFCEIDNIIIANENQKGGYKFEREMKLNKKKIKEVMLKKSNIPKGDLKYFFKKEKIPLLLSNLKNKVSYIPRNQRPATVPHIGQLKLFLSTIQFLLYYAPKNKEVHIIYPGSAPCQNLPMVSDMFPHCIWYLIDPRDFYKPLYNHPKVKEIKHDLFTNELVQKYKKELQNKYTLLISDIRIQPSEEGIHRDMMLQKEWVEKLQPTYFQFKHRLPREIDKKPIKQYPYLDGKCYLQLFPAVSTTETRLVGSGKKIKYKDWDINDYEDKLYFFNRVERSSYYKHNYNNNKCIDHCYDCSAMINLLEEYKKKYNDTEFGKLNIKSMINKIIKYFNYRPCKLMNEIRKNIRE